MKTISTSAKLPTALSDCTPLMPFIMLPFIRLAGSSAEIAVLIGTARPNRPETTATITTILEKLNTFTLSLLSNFHPAIKHSRLNPANLQIIINGRLTEGILFRKKQRIFGYVIYPFSYIGYPIAIICKKADKFQ